jgi:WhiB family redox-sensing transcriptional regulator
MLGPATAPPVPDALPAQVIQKPFREADWSWQARAACRGVDPEIFFPATDEEAAAAKAVCAGCQVRLACLAFALRWGERYGVWGGLTEKERAQIPPAERERILGRAHGEGAA